MEVGNSRQHAVSLVIWRIYLHLWRVDAVSVTQGAYHG